MGKQRAVWGVMRTGVAAMALSCVVACASEKVQAQKSTAPQAPVEQPAKPSPELKAWLEDARKEARAKGVSDAIWNQAMAGFRPIPKIIQLDRKQPEGTKTLAQYMTSTVNKTRIAEAKRLYVEHKQTIDFISKHYKVQPEFILSLWGMETNFGKVMGGFSVPHALATLAHDGRRAAFFRDEWMKSLQILQAGHIKPDAMKGSWAGAMGQCQFMPSAFLSFAVDANRDGHKDIWKTKEDVFASIANYLHKSGWDGTVGWGMPVAVPQGVDASLMDIKTFRPMAYYHKLGVTLRGGAALPKDAHEFALIYAGKPHEGAYLVSKNYSVILKWNRSRYFATSVGTLADAIAR